MDAVTVSKTVDVGISQILRNKEQKRDLINLRIDKTVHAGLKTTKRVCNENCVFDRKRGGMCHDDSFYLGNGTALANADFIRLVERISAISGKKTSVHIAGDGEPTLLGSELVDLVKRLKELECVKIIKLTTNGTRLSSGNPTLASMLKEAGLDGINVSMHSITRDGFKDVTGIDALQKVLEGIDTAVKSGLPVSINCIVRDETFKELDKYIDLAKEKGVKIKFFSLLAPDLKTQEYYYSLLDRMHSELEKLAEESHEYVFPYKGRIYKIKGALVDLKDSRDNTCPNLACNVRDICLEGCRYHVRLSRDGVMQPCGVKFDNIVNLMEQGVSEKQIVDALKAGGKM